MLPEFSVYDPTIYVELVKLIYSACQSHAAREIVIERAMRGAIL